MGQRLEPNLAVAFMSKVEAPVIDLRPLLYCSYIDDCFVICSTKEEMDKCFESLNEQSKYIKFTRGKPKGNRPPFLNVQINLSENGYITKWYRKPSSKNIVVHYLSSHPSHTKRALIRNMFRTAASVIMNKSYDGVPFNNRPDRYFLVGNSTNYGSLAVEKEPLRKDLKLRLQGKLPCSSTNNEGLGKYYYDCHRISCKIAIDQRSNTHASKASYLETP
ncbi:unnamed protein product [Angiostrongylus costaricensis]|uniref:Reverse transcriptase domain-containing protein n=1 Tax=Angiostrongylus costaricensis TaxID=334426 RepID=A0A0R3PMB1_ANGCS|nr:unnamed protein product [Angiostrongylus costaricensis]